MSNAEKFERFRALHVPGDPVILYNIWDVGSALAVKQPLTRFIEAPLGQGGDFGSVDPEDERYIVYETP